jgi:D-alanyl-D-alanine carboxypeptidase/D-alanyl-D-alanine-endopeptidase (penicillin-binding protein 4)
MKESVPAYPFGLVKLNMSRAMLAPRYLALLFALFLLPLAGNSQAGLRRNIQKLESWLADSEVFRQGFTGFCLFDPEARQSLINWQGDRYYTPASNTKIITTFASLTMLGEGMPVVHYQAKGDTLWLWGTGYPLLLHPDFVGYDTLAPWLAGRPEQVWVLADGHYRDGRFGDGWSWDDYPYGYQMEKAALPIYGNGVHFRKDSHLGRLQVQPTAFQDLLIYQDGPTLGRLEDRNVFTFGPAALTAKEIDRHLPFRYSGRLAAELLADTFKRTVQHLAEPLPDQYETLRVSVPDTLYRQLLRQSDNFLAEQMLLVCSAQRYGWLETSAAIDYVNDTLLAHLPQPFDWVDGSGLSRYNQMSPQSIILVLDQLLGRYPEDKLLSLFPAGGESGTISRWYGGEAGNPAYVFAKTGTLRHVHCLSGYLRAESGKLYLFSFMHNNFPDKINRLKEEMELFLAEVRERL